MVETKDLQTRFNTLLQVFDNWLSDDNEYLLRAVQQTIEEGFFNFSDVQFALKSLKKSLSEKSLKKWIRQSGIADEQDARGKNVLCLHAGNLPLVGFQDALAVLLSGARYSGKISRKDPYLLPTFLNEVKKTETWSGIDVQWSHRIDDFEDMQNDMILFAGSEKSVTEVKGRIQKLNMKKKEAQYLIRTAHFSIACFDEKSEENLKYLAEAILRYGGKGCRSVAVVVSPHAFYSVKNDLKKQAENFWENHPQHIEPKPKLHQRFAYNKAVKRDQLWLGNFLVQEEGLELDQDFICYWVQGDEKKVEDLKAELRENLQSIYITWPEVEIPDESAEVELLEKAQQPEIYWKPDGTDILKWLCR